MQIYLQFHSKTSMFSMIMLQYTVCHRAEACQQRSLNYTPYITYTSPISATAFRSTSNQLTTVKTEILDELIRFATTL